MPTVNQFSGDILSHGQTTVFARTTHMPCTSVVEKWSSSSNNNTITWGSQFRKYPGDSHYMFVPPLLSVLFDGFLSGLCCCAPPQTHFLVGLLCQVPTEIMRRKLASVSRTRIALDLSTTFTPAQTIVFALEGRLMCDLNISESLSTDQEVNSTGLKLASSFCLREIRG